MTSFLLLLDPVLRFSLFKVSILINNMFGARLISVLLPLRAMIRRLSVCRNIYYFKSDVDDFAINLFN